MVARNIMLRLIAGQARCVASTSQWSCVFAAIRARVGRGFGYHRSGNSSSSGSWRESRRGDQNERQAFPKFLPDKVSVKVGQTVEWVNNAKTLHSVDADPSMVQKSSDVGFAAGSETF